MGSLSLRPDDSLTVPRTALSAGFIRFVSSTNATQATGFRLFPRWDLPPTEHASLSLVALWPENSNQEGESVGLKFRMRQSPDGEGNRESLSVSYDRAGRLDESAATECDRVFT